MKKLLLVVSVAMVMTSCHPVHCTYRKKSLFFSVQNFKGENLLNPKTPGHFSVDSIKIYYLTNGKESGLTSFTETLAWDKLAIETPICTGDKGIYSVRIHWPDNSTDTLKGEFDWTSSRGCRSFLPIKVWLNGILKWETGKGERYDLIIIKNPKV